MELWVRSQDKRTLLKANRIDVDDTNIICWDNDYRCSETYMGNYKTQKRALEVLDEIQEKLQNKFLCKPTCVLKAKDIDIAEGLLNFKYKNEHFIMQPPAIDIEPINCDIVVYEMPKE